MMRRKRLRKALMPSLPSEMDVDELTPKPLKPASNENKPTNIQTLTDQLSKITVKNIVKEHKKKRKPIYIKTSSLFDFKRQTVRYDD